MAAITSSNVTLISSWEVRSYGGFFETVRIVDIALTAQGGTANDIPASALGYRSINWAMPIRALDGSSNLRHVPILLEADGEGLLTVDIEASTDADRANPANWTGTVRVMLAGHRDQNT
jgi:hypothetical protein